MSSRPDNRAEANVQSKRYGSQWFWGSQKSLTQSVASENSGAAISSNGAGATVWVRESAITRNGTPIVGKRSWIEVRA